MTASPTSAPRAPQVVERFLKQLSITLKAVRLYPMSSQIPQDNARIALDILRLILERQPVMSISIAKDGIFYEGAQVFPDNAGFEAFAREFYARNLSEVRFHAGCGADEIAKFLSMIDMPPEEIIGAGGFEAQLWEMQIDSITVTEVSSRIVEHEDGGTEAPASVEGEAWPPTPERIDELVEGAQAGRPRDQRLLVKVIREPGLLSQYLTSPSESRGIAPDEGGLAARVTSMAHAVQFELPEDQETLLRSIADSVMELEPEVRSRLVRVRLLDDARLDDMVAEVVRQMSLDEIMDSILHDVSDTPESRSGLSRAIRNLAMINLSVSRQSVMDTAATAMRSRGVSEEFVGAVMESAAPTKIEMTQATRMSSTEPVANILRLVDLAPEHSAAYKFEESTAELRAEAARGITDGDVVSVLVALALLDKRPAQFASIMALLEDSIGILIDLQEYEVAADAAEALLAATSDPELDDGQRKRVRQVLDVLARPEATARVAAALRVHRHDSPEHAACRRLLGLLGEQTIGSLLEVLAKEQDMQARKSIVDLLSGMADRFIPELGNRVNDHRWYFVRNVVAILASTREPKALPHLQRTLRHGDARVRRETIRGLASIRDALADEMLVAALADEDSQNVQLAARYLGSLGVRGAAPALEEVARGMGRGNRENGPRIEAIEALGRIGAPSSIAILQEICRGGGFMSQRREKEIRAAAQAAVGAIRARASSRGGA